MERRHQFETIACRATLGLFARRLEILAMLDQIGAERPHRAFFSTELPCGT